MEWKILSRLRKSHLKEERMAKICKTAIICGTSALLLTTAATVYAGQLKNFIGFGGTKIHVSSDHSISEPYTLSSEKGAVIDVSENPEIGEIITVDGIKERIIAVGKNGEFITELID